MLYAPYSEGGAEFVVCRLAEGLRARGHEVRVLTTQPRGEARRDVIDGITVDYVPVRNLFRPYGGPRRSAPVRALWHLLDSRNPLMQQAVSQRLRDWRPDVLHSHNVVGFSTAAWRAAAAAGVAVVHTLHDYHVLCPASNLTQHGRPCAPQRCPRCRFYSLPRRASSQYVDQVIGVSRHVLQRHLDAGAFARAESQVVPNACYVTPDPTIDRTSAVRRIGFLGRMVPEKGIETLLAAWATRPLQADVELHLAGTGRADHQQYQLPVED